MLAEFTERILHTEREKAVDHMAAAELTLSQVRMLFTLMHHGRLATHELADEVELSLAAVVRAADRLVSTGMLDRREDPSDRRVKLLSLTPKADEMMATHFRIHTDKLRDMVGAMPDDVRRRLASAMTEALEYLPVPLLHHGCQISKK